MKKIELLSPAGSYEIFLLALRAGADAVYFAGPQFGARAFAKNFTSEEVIKAIDVAHLFDKKVYLTVNTLLKDKELQHLYEYLVPFYKEGLDGIIVQDLGVLNYVRKTFPELEIHASTQMAIMGENGINFLEKENVKRVVLARELSIDEIKEIKENTNLELEIFVHGAMCYSYSGQCLLSSMIGGRSGNRGRCAQPCRLPYKTNGHNMCYPISMKDQCAITHLEELINIGVDSLKIEGRMKKPEYVAKVTSIYRKYIDQIYEKVNLKSNRQIHISSEDKKMLESLYVRDGLHDGYFYKENSKDMITLDTSAYKETKDTLLDKIRQEMELYSPLKIKLRCNISVYVGQSLQLKVQLGRKYYAFEGKPAEMAKNQPISEKNIKKQLNKTKDTFFEFSTIHVDTDDKCFVPMGELNALRREALETIKLDLIKAFMRTSENENESILYQNSIGKKVELPHETSFSVTVSTVNHIYSILKFSFERVYIPIELYEENQEIINDIIKTHLDTEFFLALPYVLRQKDLYQTEHWTNLLNQSEISGVLVRTMEEVSLLSKLNYSKIIQLDYFMYCMNTSVIEFWEEKNCQWTYPLELNGKELKYFRNADEMLVYGLIPVMLSANCINKTLLACDKKNATYILKDRMNKAFPVKMNCKYCFNTMYNSIPLSLHNYLNEMKASRLRLEFVDENEDECEKICDFFINKNINFNDLPFNDYTNGHYKRGVE